MKKIVIMAAALLVIISCQKNKDTEVESEDTLIENTDTISIDTDTVGMGDAETTIDAIATDKAEVISKDGGADLAYASFGDKIAANKAISKEEMLKKYKNLKAGDTISVKFRSKIKNVCQKKGCWMSMALPGGEESFVRFKDYGFFVPLNASEQEAIVSGKAFVDEISVAELKHYAKDEGKSDDEIAKITKPKVTYAFQADGVLISQ